MNTAMFKQIIIFILIAMTCMCCSDANFSEGVTIAKPKQEIPPTNSDLLEAADGANAQQQWDDLGMGGALRGTEQSFTVEGSLGLVDVFFAFDTSSSMNDEKASLEANMQSFVDELEKQKIDYRVSAIGQDFNFPMGLPPTKFAVIPQGISSNNAISRINQVFVQEKTPLPLPLREGAKVEVIIVTDDEGVGAGNLTADFKGPPGKAVIVDSIVGLKDGQDPVNPACTVVKVGQQYINLSNLTKGQIFNLCDALKNFSGILKKISQQIVINTRGFALNQPLNLDKPFLVKLNDTILDTAKVSYEPSTNKILLSTDIPLKPGDKVMIRYLKKPGAWL